MNLTATLLLTIAGAIPVEATTLDGMSVSGELSALSAESATLDVEGESQTLPVADLYEIRVNKSLSVRPPAREVRLHDGSRIGFEQIELSSRTAAVTSERLGSIDLPRPSIQSIRLARIDSKVESDWNDLLQRQTRDDLVVIRKGDALDHIAGVVSGINDQAVQLLLDGSPVPVPRERVFGVILAPANVPDPDILGRVEGLAGERLAITGIRFEEQTFHLQIAAGPGVRIPADQLARIDFSLGKIAYLADLEPARVAYPTGHELFLLDVWKYRKGTNSQNDLLQVGQHDYPRGLWIHSGTTLTWRLNRQYRHLRGVAGIAAGISENCNPTVGLVIRGDGSELLNVPIARGADVFDLDVDVSGVRELQIEVTSTDPDGICEHLGLGEVRVVK